MNLADAAVAVVSNIQIAGDIESHADGVAYSGIVCRAAIPGIAGDPIASHSGDDAVNVHLADAIVDSVCNIQVADGIESETLGIIQAGVGGRAAIPGIAGDPIASHSGDDAVGVHLADEAADIVTKIEVAGRVEGHAKAFTNCRHGGNDAVGVHLADAMV